MLSNSKFATNKDASEHRSRIEDVIRAVEPVMTLRNQARILEAPTSQPSRDVGPPPTVPCAAEAMNKYATTSIGEGVLLDPDREDTQQEQLDDVPRSLGMDLHTAPLPAVATANKALESAIPSGPKATCTAIDFAMDVDVGWAAAYEAINLPMPAKPAGSLLPSPSPQPPVRILLAGPVPEPRWKKYSQKRVAGHQGVPRAVLKQSYKCQHPDCTAVKVTCRDTVHDGPYSPQLLEFFGLHNH